MLRPLDTQIALGPDGPAPLTVIAEDIRHIRQVRDQVLNLVLAVVDDDPFQLVFGIRLG